MVVTVEEVNKAKHRIDSMTQVEMAHLWRFAPIGHPYFDKTNSDLSEYFEKRFKTLGGMTPAISKALG